MNEIKDFIIRLDRDYPGSKKELVTFPSGAYMLYFYVAGDEYVLEYLPSLKAYGVSKVKNATYGWEGVEKDFTTFEAATQFALHLLTRPPTPR